MEQDIAASMTGLDWAVIAAYVTAMLAIGWYYSRRTETTDDYLLGGRTMRPTAVGLSLFASLFSTITYLAMPGEMVRHGPMFFAGLLAFPVVYVLAGWFLIPHFMRLKAASGYELLERRLGVGVRLTAVGMFLLIRVLWMAVVIYATVDVVLVPTLGWSPATAPWLCAAMGALTIIYTSMGGLRAVVVTDATQTIILFGGALTTLALATWAVGGIGGWWPQEWSPAWDEPRLVIDGDQGRGVLSAFIAGAVWYLATAGSDQMAIQRYMATRDVKAARRVLMVSLTSGACIKLLLAAVGLALLAYYQASPEFLPAGVDLETQADRLFPAFIVSNLPMGMSGLIIAGLLAAAMSSLSSGLNSGCAVITVDIVDRFRRPQSVGRKSDDTRTETDHVGLARWISVGIGLLVVAMSTGVGYVHGNLLEVAFKVVNLLVAPLFGLFVMALFVSWATGFGTMIGAAAGVTTGVLISYWREMFGSEPPISFFWAMPVSLIVQVAVGAAVSLLPIGKARQTLDEMILDYEEVSV